MMRSTLAYELSLACYEGIEKYGDRYIRDLRTLFQISQDSSLLRADIRAKTWGEAEDIARFSVMFNDVSFLTVAAKKRMHFIVIEPEKFEHYYGTKDVKVRFPASGVRPSKSDKLNAALIFPSDQAAEARISEFAPLIETGRLVLRPRRTVLLRDPVLNQENSYNWRALPVDENSPLEAWEVNSLTTEHNQPTPMVVDNHDDAESAAFKITLPYIKGVPIKDFAQIILDEEDLLSGLRSAVRQAISEATESSRDYKTIVSDLINPKIDSIDRQMRKIANMRLLKLGGASVGTVLLAYTSASTVDAPAALAAVFGAGGLGLVGSAVVESMRDTDKVAESPFYVLWKCRRATRRLRGH